MSAVRGGSASRGLRPRARESRAPSPPESTPPAPWPARRASRNKSSSPAKGESRGLRAEMQERCEPEEARAREGREEARADAVHAAEGQDADHGDRNGGRAEQAGREPEECSESNEEREFQGLDEICRGGMLRLRRHGPHRRKEIGGRVGKAPDPRVAEECEGQGGRAEHSRREPDEVPNAEGQLRVVSRVIPAIPELRDRCHRKETRLPASLGGAVISI